MSGLEQILGYMTLKADEFMLDLLIKEIKAYTLKTNKYCVFWTKNGKVSLVNGVGELQANFKFG